MKYITLKGEKLNVDIKNYYEYLSPNYIFVPFLPAYSSKKESNESVFKEELVLKGKNKFYSSVSGRVIGIKEFNNYLNVNSKYLIIENDYKEKYEFKKSINKNYLNTKKIDLINYLEEYNSCEMNNILDFIKSHEIITNIIVIGFDDNLYSYQNRYYLEEDITKIFDSISLLNQVLDINKSYLLIKDNNSKVINNVVDFEGTYPDISVNYLPDIYPLSCDAVLKNYTKNYLTENSLVINIEELLTLFDLMYRDKYQTDMIVTITDLIKKKVYFCKTKTYVLLANILKDYDPNAVCYINNPLNSNVVDINTTVIGPEVKSIIIDKEMNYIENPCLNCGKCIEVCPLKLPDLTNNPACVKCNLCSYMCPSGINLLKESNHE